MYRDVKPPQLVDVRRDGHWWPGLLQAWRKRDGRWQGDVTWTVDVGMRHVGWIDAADLRPV